MNKPWSYKIGGQWINFDCPECILLELSYFIYSKTFKEEHSKVSIPMGTVCFKQDLLHVEKENGETLSLDICRSLSNHLRQRSDRAERNESHIGGQLQSSVHLSAFMHHTNLEWLSLNWRKFRAA